MKILLSAYACEPNMGSEPGVGWNWAVELLNLGHEVWVLTREYHRPPIERELAKSIENPKLKFIYYDPDLLDLRWDTGKKPSGIYMHHFLWQWGAWRYAKEIHSSEKFDMVHHVTYVSVRLPSFMGNLGIPFIFGPVGGGETAPWRLRLTYPFKGMITDLVRDAANHLVKLDPFMRHTFSKADRIYTTSIQTKALVPKKYHSKTFVNLAIGMPNLAGKSVVREKRSSNTFHIVYMGRFLYWKGMHLGLKALALALGDGHDIHLTMIGDGADKENLANLSKKLKVEDKIDWVGWVDTKELPRIYSKHDVLLFPSLHDSGGMVVLEAMAHGVPVICLNLGGPGVMVDNSCGRVIEVAGLSETAVSSAIAVVLKELSGDRQLWKQLSDGALKKAAKYNWSNVVRTIYDK
ncbi:putative glycosyltransferase protein [hydrothermal vent metagenome]|uniref:Putative glycosyltransferase protein n=1 Tax=hydrothermal vent metagenome TaxID=652676 RepID=A0A3B1C6Z3_9ZZZZ